MFRDNDRRRSASAARPVPVRARLAGALVTAAGVALAAWLAGRAWQACVAGSTELLTVAVDALLAAALLWAAALTGAATWSLSGDARHRQTERLRTRLVHRIAGLLLLAGGGTAAQVPHALASPTALDLRVDAPDPGLVLSPAPAGQDAAPRPVPPPDPAPAPETTAPASTTASTDTGDTARGVPHDAPAPDLVAPGWTPSRRPPVATRQDSSLLTEHTRPEAEQQVVVRRGDSLWAIVQRHCGPQADVTTVADAVRRWHRANLATIGPDADLLHPGQLLTVPESTR